MFIEVRFSLSSDHFNGVGNGKEIILKLHDHVIEVTGLFYFFSPGARWLLFHFISFSFIIIKEGWSKFGRNWF